VSGRKLAGITLALSVMFGVFTVRATAQAADTGAAARGLAVAERILEAPSPEAAYASLSPSERADFDAANLPATAELTESSPVLVAQKRAASADADGSVLIEYCWSWVQSGRYKSLVGLTLFTYGNTVEVCYQNRNSTVTSIRVFNMWNEVKSVGWREKHEPVAKTYNARWEGRGLSQHFLAFGAGGWDINHPTTCLQQRLSGNGHDRRALISCNLS